MKAQMLKLAGVKDEKAFYKKFPSEEAFMKVHGKAFKKAQLGISMSKYNVSNNWNDPNSIIPGTVNSFDLSQQWTNTLPGSIPKAQDGIMQSLQPRSAKGAIPISALDTKTLATPFDNTNVEVMPYIQAGSDIIQGLSMIKGQKQKVKQAKTQADVSGLQLQAARSRDVDFNTMNQQLMIRPEDRQDTGEEFFPINGVDTNVLQGKNGMTLKRGGEIQNTYAPNNLYDDLGIIPIAQNGFVSALNSNAGMDIMNKAGMFLTNNNQGPDAGSEIGGGIGSAVGTYFGGPVGSAIGKFAGNVIGGAIDRSDVKIRKYNNQTDRNQQAAQIAQMDMSNGFMEEGGNLTNPQLITKFGDIDVTDIHEIAHQGMDTLRTGGNIRENYNYPQDKFAMNGLQVYKGEAEPVSQNPYLPEGGETVMFNGPSHKNGGMPIKYGDQGVEVEGGEPAVKLEDGGDTSLTVFGNLKPSKKYLASVGLEEFNGQKFKGIVDKLTKKTDKLNTLLDKSTDKIDNHPMNTSIDKLGFGSWKANIMGANMTLKDIADKTEKAAALQQIINETADEHNLVADDLARGIVKKAKAKKATAQKGITMDDNHGLVPWQGNVSPGDKYGKKTASSFTLQDWTKIADELGFKGKGNKEFQEFLLKNPESLPLIQKRHQELYGTAPFIDSKLGYGWEAQGLNNDLQPIVDEKSMTYTDPKIKFNYRNPIFNLLDQPINVTDEPLPAKVKNKVPWVEAINSVMPYLRPNYQLDRPDLSAEMMAMGFNQLEPVQARGIHSQLDVPYDISYQDLLNKNQGDFRAISKMAQNNPALLAQLSAQKYGADQQVLGEQFRANQAMKDKVYSQNRNIINQDQLKNLEIMDNQYVRQATAKSKTQEEAVRIASSISDKLNRYKEEQQLSNLESQRYNYRFDNNGRAINMNPLAQFNLTGAPAQPSRARGELAPGYEDYYDISGQRIGTKRATKDDNAKNGKKITIRNGAIVKALKTI